MSIIRVQAVFTISGRVNDTVTNVFHFTGPGTYAEDQPNAEAAVAAFYGATQAGETAPLGAVLPVWLARPWVTRSYNLEAAPPRQPILTAHTLPAAASASSTCAAETCAVLSLYGPAPTTRRSRGRIYLPLASTVTGGGLDTGPIFIPIGGTLWNRASKAALSMISNPLIDWVIRSEASTPALHSSVVRVSMDQDPDTQRRRGADGTARQTTP